MKGYTLIEILVGITIIALIFSIGFVNFREFSRRQQLNTATKSIQADLRSIQQMALSGNKPDSINCNTPNTLDGFLFQRVSESQYSISARCSAGDVAISTKDLSGVTITTPTQNTILFKVLGQGTNISSGSSAQIVVTQNESGASNTINVTHTGDIR